MATPVTLEECEVNLNINIPYNVWEENPKFAGLLSILATEKLPKLSIPRSTWEKYETMIQETNKEKAKLFYHKLLFDTLLDLLYDRSVDDSPIGLMASHALDYISLQEADISGPVIVPKKYTNSFLKEMENPEGFEMLKSALVPEIQKSLEGYALKLIQLRDSSIDPDKPALWMAKFRQLPLLIKQEIKMHDEHEKATKINSKLLDKNLESWTQKQTEVSELMETYYKEKSDYTMKKESLEANVILSKYQTMTEKLEGLEKQLKVETYTPEDVKALEIIRKSLIDMKQKIAQEIAETKTILNSYASLGPEFTHIVEEFTDISHQIDASKDVLKN